MDARTCGLGWFNWCWYVDMKDKTIVGKALHRPVQPAATGCRKVSGSKSALIFQKFRIRAGWRNAWHVVEVGG